MGHRLWGDKVARTDRQLPRRLSENSFACFRLALLTGVGVVHILPDPEPGRLYLQVPAHLFPNLLNHGAAEIAGTLSLGVPSGIISSTLPPYRLLAWAFTATRSAVAFLAP